MNKRFKLFVFSMFAVLLIAGAAHAVNIKGRDISTIPDILRHSRGLTGEDVTLELRKDSLLRLHNNVDDDMLDLRYNIGNGDKDLSLGGVNAAQIYSFDGVIDRFLIPAQTKFNGNKVLVASSLEFVNDDGNWFYDLYFLTVSKNDEGGGGITQSKFGAWRYPNGANSGNSGYLKDIDTGISVKGFDGELVVASTMTATNDKLGVRVNYNTKTAGARFDFWALFPNTSGDVQYKKIDNLTQTKSGFIVPPLQGIHNAPDAEWASTNNLSNTTASPYMIIKTAAGDFNNDGYENEIAVLATDQNGIYIWMYQLEYNAGTFTIKTIKDKTTIFNYRYPGYFKTWSYNGWNRVPGADILAGDFDGDGQTELAVIFQGDFPSGERNAMMFGGTVKTLHTNLYKWDNNTGDLKATTYEVDDYEMTLQSKAFTYAYYTTIGKHNYKQEKKRGHTRQLKTSWGGFKATVLDLDGDGKDEIAFAGYRSDLFYKIKDVDTGGYESGADHHAEYKVRPYLSLVKMDSDGKLKSTRIFEGDPLIDRRYTNYNKWDEDNTSNYNAFNLQECDLNPQNSIRAEVYPFTENQTAIAAGAFYGQTGLAKERDDLTLCVYRTVILFKSSGSTLNSAQSFTARGKSALAAGDFAAEGIELGNPTFVTRTKDKSYMAVIQAPPFHVDTIAADGKTISPTPVNFSFTKGAHVSYGKSGSKSTVQTTKFDMHSSVETIFAMDSDTTRNVIGGARTAQKVYGAIKNIASIIPGTSNFENVVKKAKDIDGVVSPVFNFLDKITDKVETVKTGYDKELTESETFSTITAKDQDTFAFVEADQYMWRYPIVTKPAPNLRILSDDAKYLTKQDFVTFTIYGDTTPTTGLSASDYQPTHENGNLFSYPSAIGNIEDYDHRQKDLSNAARFQFGVDASGWQSFTQVQTNEKTESKKVSTGSLSNAISLVDSIFGTDLAKIPDGETGPTYTRTENSSERIDWELPRDPSELDSGYWNHYQAYVAENGAVTCGFAVSDFNRNLNLFKSDSLYGTSPDIAFPLPHKFKISNPNSTPPTFSANMSREEAMEIRGARFYAIDYNKYTSSRLLKGARYTIKIPIYNASFVTANNVEVSLYWAADRKENTAKNLIQTKTVSSLSGWSNTGNNKAWVEFEFTPNMQANKAGEHYQLYALIDPDNKIKEVHEKRSASDYGGNNEGYIEFSVETVESAQATASFYASGLKAAGLTLDDIVWPEMTFGGYDTWPEFYNAKIANTEGPVSIDFTVENKMDITIPRVEIIAGYVAPNSANSDEIRCAHFARDITLFPNETYTYSFTIPADVADELRAAGSGGTTFGCTLKSLLELIDDEVILSGDPNPEFEDNGEPSGDNQEETDDTRYYDAVITQTYTLSNDTAVFWRIEGIADVISNTNDTAPTDVKDAAISTPATQEEFSIVWNPSDAETVQASSIELTISTIPGVTRAGQYAFTIQTSENGEDWTEKDALIFGDAESGINRVGSSGGGCNAGYSALALMLAALMIKRRTR